jgi:hypothetical protein
MHAGNYGECWSIVDSAQLGDRKLDLSVAVLGPGEAVFNAC